MTISVKHSFWDYCGLVASIAVGLLLLFVPGTKAVCLAWEASLSPETSSWAGMLLWSGSFPWLVAGIVLATLWANMIRQLWKNPGALDH